MIAARKFISDLLFIKYLVLRWEINIRKGERDQTRGEKKKKKRQQERRDEMLWGWLEGAGAPRRICTSSHLSWDRGKRLTHGRDSHAGDIRVLAPSRCAPVHARDTELGLSAQRLVVFAASDAPCTPSAKKPDHQAPLLVCTPAPPPASHPGRTANLLRAPASRKA